MTLSLSQTGAAVTLAPGRVSMLELQEEISKARTATASLRRGWVDRATREYFESLGLVRAPSADDFEAAQSRAGAFLKRELLAPATAKAVGQSPDGCAC